MQSLLEMDPDFYQEIEKIHFINFLGCRPACLQNLRKIHQKKTCVSHLGIPRRPHLSIFGHSVFVQLRQHAEQDLHDDAGSVPRAPGGAQGRRPTES